jgi:hypothetical protein
MFGYVLPDKPELKIKDFDRFKAYYCGLCHTIGKNCGQMGRLFLNYDCTFLAVLLESVSEMNGKLLKSRCVAHPLKKGSYISNSKFIDYASDINVILAYYKLVDDWHDERKLLKASAMLSLKSAAKRVRKRRGEECRVVESRVNELSKLEKASCKNIDEAAEPFSKLLEELFFPIEYKDLLFNSEKQLKWLGYNIGKWIYIIDAFDDLKKDIKSGAYNPILKQFDYDKNETFEIFRDRITDRVEIILMNCLVQVSLAYEMLDIKGNKSILDNIIYSGLRVKTEIVIRSCECSEKSI